MVIRPRTGVRFIIIKNRPRFKPRKRDYHLEQGVPGVGSLGQPGDFILDIGFVAMEQAPDVQHHVQFPAPVIQRPFRLKHLDGGMMRPVGKADHGAGLHIAAGKQLHHQRHIPRPGADGGGIVLQGDIAALADIILRQKRLEGGMIQHFGNVAQ